MVGGAIAFCTLRFGFGEDEVIEGRNGWVMCGLGSCEVHITSLKIVTLTISHIGFRVPHGKAHVAFRQPH